MSAARPSEGAQRRSPVSGSLVFWSGLPQPMSRQRGQALVEAVSALLGLVGLGVAVVWIAGLQDMSLQAGHASRLAVFDHARRSPGSLSASPVPLMRGALGFTPFLHRWSTRDGRRLLPRPERVEMAVTAGVRLSSAAVPGDVQGEAMAADWRVGQATLLHGVVSLPAVLPSLAGGIGSEAGRLGAQSYLLAGSGHARHDVDVQLRVAAGRRSWGDAATPSGRAAARVRAAMEPVDAPWGRGGAELDWLLPWAGWVPSRHRSDSTRRPRS